MWKRGRHRKDEYVWYKSCIYQSKTAYNDRNIIAGDASDTNILSLGANAYNLRLGRCQEFSNVAIYYFALYDKSLTPDEIEQEKIKLNEIWTKRLNGWNM